MKTCSVDGCERKARSKTLCDAHYKRLRRNGDPLISGWDVPRDRKSTANHRERATVEKKCAMCLVVKSSEEFHSVTRNRPAEGLHGEYLLAYCKPCHRAYYRAKRLEHRKNNPDKRKVFKAVETCEFDGCTNKAKSRYQGKGLWLCLGHWQQRRAGKELQPLRVYRLPIEEDGLRECIDCEKVKPLEAFYLASRRPTPQTSCKACMSLANSFHQYRRAGRLEQALETLERAPERMRNRLLGKYATVFNGSEFERSNEKEETNA